MKDLGKVPQVVREVVGEEDAGQRIDNYLVRRCKGVPKSHLYQVLRSGQVRVNSRRVDQTYRLQANDEVRIPPLRVAAAPDRPAVPLRNLPVLFEDEALIAIDKPAGLAVHGGSGVSFGVIETLRRARPQAKLLELAHRLDRETSGVLLVAKKRSALAELHRMFRDGGITKHYLTLVAGRWVDPLRNIRLPLEKYLTAEGERRVAVSEEGKAAHTIVRLLHKGEAYSLLDVELRTGRTHQIRVHLSHLGYPLCGDDKYGDFALNKALQRDGLKRMFLHAAELTLPHPLSREPLTLRSPLPQDLAGFLHKVMPDARPL
jgi:23S rRNA pseudouridine955/2504/2580 synthase